ncbi:RibD family protein [Cryptosporangium sp. NPDC048952]|uniref:RibD family protein n=1 Tax=Cryptosporangium sp. NPDC048952 TaxID=3363961 RepID=UPI003711C5A1
MSVDGYLDDATPNRLLLSNDEDFDRVDAVRATCDAILVGAETVRRDNPRLLVRSAARRAARERPLLRVVLSRSGNLDPAAAVFGPDAPTVVYRGEPLPVVLEDLVGRGVRRLLVEGGGTVQAQFLTAGLVDELHLVVAPIFVGDPAAPRFAGPGVYPDGRMRLVETRPIGDVVLLRYLLGSDDGD